MNHDTPDIRLRAMEPEDLDTLYRIENDRRLWNTGATNVPYSRFTLHNYIADSVNDIYADRQLRLMIEHQDRVVGIIDLMNFDPRHSRAELGIVIIDSYRRRGFATAAIGRIASYARDTLHLHQLYAIADTTNRASIATLLSAGFRRTATLADWLHCPEGYRPAELMQLTLSVKEH